MSADAHCFHGDGYVYCTNPPFYYEQCCRCGKRRRVGGRLVQIHAAGHGRFLRGGEYTEVPDVEDIGPCMPPPEGNAT